MAKYVYPAIFTIEENGMYAIDFPDIEGCHTSGDSLCDGVEMAVDAMSMMLCYLEQEGKPIPKPTPIKQIEVDENSFTTLIVGDTTDYPLVKCDVPEEQNQRVSI